MKNKLSLFLLLLLCSITLIGCKKEVTVKGISVDENTIPSFVLNTEVSEYITDMKLIVSKSDDSKEEVNVTTSMLNTEDLNSLSTTGSKEITISYEGQSTKVTLNVVNYLVSVVYPDGTPVTSNTSVQWCEGDICYLPVKVNNEGNAGIALKDNGEYYIHLNVIPTGYTYDPNAYITNSSNKHVTIKLIEVSALNGEGSKDNPYTVSTSAYSLTYEAKGASAVQYFSFTPTSAGTYKITSLAVDKLAQNLIDPYIGFLGTDINKSLAESDTSGNITNVLNFSHTLVAEANTTYYFVVMVSNAENFPATFNVVISK